MLFDRYLKLRNFPLEKSRMWGSGLAVLLIGLVAGGALYCLLTQPHIISGLTPQGPIGFH